MAAAPPQLGDAAVDRLIRDAASSSSFEFVRRVDGIDVYYSPRDHSVRAVTVVSGTVESLVRSLAAEGRSNQGFRKRMFQSFYGSFVDGERLQEEDATGGSVCWLGLHHECHAYDMTLLARTFVADPWPTTRHDRQPTHLRVGGQVWQSVNVPRRVGKPRSTFTRLVLASCGFVVRPIELVDSTHAMCTVSFVLQVEPVPNHHDLALWFVQLAHSATLAFATNLQAILPKSLWTHNSYCYL
ncbi:hypothetical protein DYB32_010346, partial [Aphanomyces invadans]